MLTLATAECGACDAPTSRTAEDNDHNTDVLCEDCYPDTVWAYTHPWEECDGACFRDHAHEAYETRKGLDLI